jgi:hypothetical protein
MSGDILLFPSKPAQGGKRPVDEDLFRRVIELYHQTPVMSMAQNMRIVVDCLKRAKPRGGSKLKPDLKRARDTLVALAEKGKRPLEEILDLASSIAMTEMAIEEGKRPAADRGTARVPNRCRARGGHALRLVNSAPPHRRGFSMVKAHR